VTRKTWQEIADDMNDVHLKTGCYGSSYMERNDKTELEQGIVTVML